MIDEETKQRIYRDAGMNALPQNYSIPASLKTGAVDRARDDELTFDLRWVVYGTDEIDGSKLKVGVIRRDALGQYRFLPNDNVFIDSKHLRDIARFLDATNTGREKILS